MAASATAAWLDSFFAGYDHFFLNILHVLGDKAGAVLTPLMRVITFLGEKGIVFFLLALVFRLMADKRDLGVCIFGAVCCGALITNIILKDSVGRLRPFEMVPEYQQWWVAIGAPAEDGCSFPSGHVTACAAGMTAITLMRGKKWILPSVLIVFFMGVSRNYLMAHYPSDVLFAAIIGVFSGVVSWLITQLIFRFLSRKRRSSPLCAAILDFDIRDVLPLPGPLGGNGAPRPAPRLPRRRSPRTTSRPIPAQAAMPSPQPRAGARCLKRLRRAAQTAKPRSTDPPRAVPAARPSPRGPASARRALRRRPRPRRPRPKRTRRAGRAREARTALRPGRLRAQAAATSSAGRRRAPPARPAALPRAAPPAAIRASMSSKHPGEPDRLPRS